MIHPLIGDFFGERLQDLVIKLSNRKRRSGWKAPTRDKKQNKRSYNKRSYKESHSRMLLPYRAASKRRPALSDGLLFFPLKGNVPRAVAPPRGFLN